MAGMWVVVVLTTGWMALGSWVALFPGTLEELFGTDYSIQDAYGVSRIRFEVFTLGTLAIIVADRPSLGYIAGAGVRAQTVDVGAASLAADERAVTASYEERAGSPDYPVRRTWLWYWSAIRCACTHLSPSRSLPAPRSRLAASARAAAATCGSARAAVRLAEPVPVGRSRSRSTP